MLSDVGPTHAEVFTRPLRHVVLIEAGPSWVRPIQPHMFYSGYPKTNGTLIKPNPSGLIIAQRFGRCDVLIKFGDVIGVIYCYIGTYRNNGQENGHQYLAFRTPQN